MERQKPPFINVKVLRNTNFNNDGTLSWVDVAELPVEEKQFRTRKLMIGDIILERSGGGPKQPVGRVVYFDLPQEDYSFSNFTTCIRVKDKKSLNTKFLLYYLLSFYNKGKTNELQQRTTGIRNLNFADYKKIKIPLPVGQEQQSIVVVLSKIHHAIEQQERIIEKTKELKRSLMLRLFTYGLRGEELKETEIGLMPESWNAKRVKDICIKPQYGFTETATDKEVGPKFLRITDITDKGVEWNAVPYCKCPADKIEKYKLIKGDILFARIGATTGKSFIIEDCPLAVYASYLIRVRTTKAVIPLFLNYFFQSAGYWKQVNANKGSSLKQGVNGSVLADLIVPVPKMREEQEEISQTLKAVDEKINRAYLRHNKLSELFKSMLQLLMTGQARVKDIDFGGVACE
jgi:type I restriction enzyme S subunit